MKTTAAAAAPVKEKDHKSEENNNIPEKDDQQNGVDDQIPWQWDEATVDALFPRAAALSFAVWLLLVVLVSTQTPPQYHEHLRSEESAAAFLAVIVMVVTLLAMLVPSLLFKQSYASGIVVAGTVVCFVAICTNLLLCFRPTVVMVDPVTKARVFLLRWCEWIPLGGLMTFLSEAVSMSETGGMKGALFSTTCQTLSIASGIILPFCNDLWIWQCVFAFSFVTYSDIFRRMFIKRKAYLQSLNCEGRFQDPKLRDRVKYAYFLILACSLVWIVLVALYCMNIWIHTRPPTEGSGYHQESYAMVIDTSFDVLAKAIYMKIITDVHQALFDKTYHLRKKLAELRKLISVMWDSSSDIILISIRTEHGRSAILSPAFFQLVGAKLPDSLLRKLPEVALMCSISKSGQFKCDYVETNDILAAPQQRNHTILESAEDYPLVLKGAKELLEITWNCSVAKGVSTPLLEHPLQGEDGTIRQSEIKISYYAESTRVGVIRDVSERYLRLEAERKAHMEVAARQKDAQAVNRFTRHEVKNGLLEGIELCDSLRSAMEDLVPQSTSNSGLPDLIDDGSRHTSGERESENSDRPVSALTRRFIEDLDYNLHSVLDVVLAEAMARDVIHGDYKPRHERIDVKGVLSHPGLGIGFTDKFPIEIVGGSLPYLSLDAQLLRHIHRNALSNACKYGKPGGTVVTQLSFDRPSKTFGIKVINEPGEMHSILVSMGESAKAAVFQQGARLHSHLNLDSGHVSSGDGAWIMQKCAKTLDGECQIEFLPDKTIFSFSCPAQPLIVTDWSNTQDFQVPPNTWGVAIDDSKIQRRLLSRIFLFAGVQESKTFVLGESYAEVAEFKEKVLSLVKEFPDDRILVLVDENLDFGKSNESPSHNMSGSLLMQDILRQVTLAEEQRVLALVRSANDSAEETELYCERTHGFFPKGPLQRDRVREIVAPLWADRFMRTDEQREKSL